MPIPVCIFEDEFSRRLHPLTLTRPVFDLRCGMFTLHEKVRNVFAQQSTVFACRKYLQELVRQSYGEEVVNQPSPDPCLFVNAAVIADTAFRTELDVSGERLFVQQGRLLAARLSGEPAADMRKGQTNTAAFVDRCDLPVSEIEGVRLVDYPWDLVAANAHEIARDFEARSVVGRIAGSVHPSAVLVNSDNIHIGQDATIKAGVILDAEQGPIYIGRNVTVMSNAVIAGPAYVGDNSIIKIGAKIYEGTSIGPVCKVGGEVECAILHGHSNKQHEGFLGHAYLGEWVNLGADTNNSDLKNNYASVRVTIDGEVVDSGLQFVGLFMGDHSKAGINTMFNTGTVVGVMSNVFGAGFPPKAVPSFSWGGAGGLTEHDFAKAIATAAQAMARRGEKLLPEQEKLLRHVFEMTQRERGGV